MNNKNTNELFEGWNEKQSEDRKINTRYQNFTSNFNENEEILVLPRVPKSFIKNGSEVKYGSLPIKLKNIKTGREKALEIELPTVIGSFKTTMIGSESKDSIAITLYRSNPDHKMFIDFFLKLEDTIQQSILDPIKKVAHGIDKDDLTGENRRFGIKLLKGKFSKIFRFEKDESDPSGARENPNSEKVYMYLNPLDFVNDKEPEKSVKMKFYFPCKNETNNDFIEAPWSAFINKPLLLEMIPKLKIMHIYDNGKFSIIIKCASVVVTDIREKTTFNKQSETLNQISELKSVTDAILEKFKNLTQTNNESILIDSLSSVVNDTNNIFTEIKNSKSNTEPHIASSFADMLRNNEEI